MPRIIDLDALVPEDLEFRYRGESYLVPGDIDGEAAWGLVKLYQEGLAAQEKGSSEQQAADALIQQALLALFRVRQPDLERLPFGLRGSAVVLAEVLVLLGFEIVSPPTPRPKEKMAVPRSRRSSGSRK
jgi:hypothetical protein